MLINLRVERKKCVFVNVHSLDSYKLEDMIGHIVRAFQPKCSYWRFEYKDISYKSDINRRVSSFL